MRHQSAPMATRTLSSRLMCAPMNRYGPEFGPSLCKPCTTTLSRRIPRACGALCVSAWNMADGGRLLRAAVVGLLRRQGRHVLQADPRERYVHVQCKIGAPPFPTNPSAVSLSRPQVPKREPALAESRWLCDAKEHGDGEDPLAACRAMAGPCDEGSQGRKACRPDKRVLPRPAH